MPLLHLDNQNFEKEIANNEVIVVDFWATWCGPCRMLAPTLEEVSEEGIVVGKVDVDECPELANQFGIRSIPTLIVFKNGKKDKVSIGLITKEQILDLVK